MILILVYRVCLCVCIKCVLGTLKTINSTLFRTHVSILYVLITIYAPYNTDGKHIFKALKRNSKYTGVLDATTTHKHIIILFRGILNIKAYIEYSVFFGILIFTKRIVDQFVRYNLFSEPSYYTIHELLFLQTEILPF